MLVPVTHVRWTRRRFVGLAGLAAAIAVACGVASALSPDDKSAPPTVRLIVDYGDNVEKHFTALEWKPGLNVFDALTQASRGPHAIAIDSRGYGDSGRLLTRIDDLANEGGGARNWIFWVNEKLSKSACDKTELKAGDVVRWKFTSRRDGA